MVKNDNNSGGIIKKLFGGKDNTEKVMLKKLKQLKSEYDDLDIKLMKGTISKKELDKYYVIKEEINTMAKKFILKDGKFVLNPNLNNTNEDVKQPEFVAPQQAVPQQQTAQPMAEQPVTDNRQAEEEQMRKMAEYEQQMKQDQLRRQAEYEQHVAQQQAQQQARQQAQQPVAQQVDTDDTDNKDIVMVALTVTDLPELSIGILRDDVQTFMKLIDAAMHEQTRFTFGEFHLNGSKIIGYRFYEPDNDAQ